MDIFKHLAIPRDIRAVIAVLQGESKEEYLALLAGIFEDLEPRDRPEYFWAIRYADCCWEIRRLKRMRSLLIDQWRDRGRDALVKDRRPEVFSNIEQHVAELYPDGLHPEIVGARAVILAHDRGQIEYFDQAIDRLQSRADSTLQLFEGRREVFTHRQREGFRATPAQNHLKIANECRDADRGSGSSGMAAE